MAGLGSFVLSSQSGHQLNTKSQKVTAGDIVDGILTESVKQICKVQEQSLSCGIVHTAHIVLLHWKRIGHSSTRVVHQDLVADWLDIVVH